MALGDIQPETLTFIPGIKVRKENLKFPAFCLFPQIWRKERSRNKREASLAAHDSQYAFFGISALSVVQEEAQQKSQNRKEIHT